ncbi:MAG: AMP-binding protein [Chitinophagaceae bacterium]
MDVINRILKHAADFPDAIAVIGYEGTVTYSEILAMVQKIAGRLSSTPNPRVLLGLKQHVEAYALIVATLYCDGTFCSVNPNTPPFRKTQIIEEFTPDFIFLEDGDELTTNYSTYRVEDLQFPHSHHHLHTKYDDEHIAYIIYTSGTTGKSKGVRIPRKALNKFIEWALPTYNLKTEDVWAQFSSLSFDLSIVDIFTCLCSGAQLVALTNEAEKTYRPSDIISRHKISIWHSVPSVVDFLMVNNRKQKSDLSSLRLMSFCGEPLLRRHVEFLFKKNPEITIFNTYGPTEGTLFCTWQEISNSNYEEYFANTCSIGNAIPGWNLQLDLTDELDEYEVTIVGEFIGAGYLGAEGQERFITLDASGQHVRAFKTGDVVKRENGNIYFICRKDRQVKVKGFRIELAEIDQRIYEATNLSSVTFAHKNSLYSFLETTEPIIVEELREYLKEKLEDFKIPVAFNSIAQLPRNTNQKIDVDILIAML